MDSTIVLFEVYLLLDTLYKIVQQVFQEIPLLVPASKVNLFEIRYASMEQRYLLQYLLCCTLIWDMENLLERWSFCSLYSTCRLSVKVYLLYPNISLSKWGMGRSLWKSFNELLLFFFPKQLWTLFVKQFCLIISILRGFKYLRQYLSRNSCFLLENH